MAIELEEKKADVTLALHDVKKDLEKLKALSVSTWDFNQKLQPFMENVKIINHFYNQKIEEITQIREKEIKEFEVVKKYLDKPGSAGVLEPLTNMLLGEIGKHDEAEEWIDHKLEYYSQIIRILLSALEIAAGESKSYAMLQEVREINKENREYFKTVAIPMNEKIARIESSLNNFKGEFYGRFLIMEALMGQLGLQVPKPIKKDLEEDPRKAEPETDGEIPQEKPEKPIVPLNPKPQHKPASLEDEFRALT